MKFILAFLSLLMSFQLANFYPEHQEQDHNEFNTQNGSIKGTVQLASKSRGVRSGGGLYGRSALSTSQAVSTDSVLVILSGDQNSLESNADFAILNQFDRKFQPGILPVELGQTVRITNSDPVYHNVFSLTSPHKFDVGRRPKGEHFDVDFDKPGMVDVFCDIHSNMHAIIYVLPPNTLQWKKIAGGETFEFDQIPPGTFTLTFYAMGYSEVERSVNVTSNQIADAGIITLNQ
ncbi:MAG: hypothetical protein JJ895_07840 [Balneolaceae bacterium]|nr:hypothetical protein [Balneolaceae bacterium]